MHAIEAFWKNGRFLRMDTVDWPEGSELTGEPIGATSKHNTVPASGRCQAG